MPTHSKSQIDGGYWVIETVLDGGYKSRRGYFQEPDLDDPDTIKACVDNAEYLREMHIQNGRYIQHEEKGTNGS